MNCLHCNKPLSKNQIFEITRGKQKGYCSRKCGAANRLSTINKICDVCGSEFYGPSHYINKKTSCSLKCAGVKTSKRMAENNPMVNLETRKKVSKTLKEMEWKPSVIGGNGRGATIPQLKLYNELIKYDSSFQMELIFKTGYLRKHFNSPTHYKIDIGSLIYKLAIECDGVSHKSLKIKECDKRKTELLNLKGWKVLRLSNFQIENEFQNCVQMVLSMI